MHKNKQSFSSSKTTSFADVAHQILTFSNNDSSSELILELIDTAWMQRLRRIKQTGNTNMVYMFAEHSRFGHSLGVAYLACLLMRGLKEHSGEEIAHYEKAVAAAALLHDVGHVAPGSHLAEKVWGAKASHETVSSRIVKENVEIKGILEKHGKNLPELVSKILRSDDSLPPWTVAIISGDGWNADRGNWTIVDSAMCSVSYGRYNVNALIDAFRLSPDKELIIQENRLDALTHFYVARDSMYRQVYQHRTLQAVDALNLQIVKRLRDLIAEIKDSDDSFIQNHIFADETMLQVLCTENYSEELELEQIFKMDESWWQYHLEHWCSSSDPILSDLALRLRDRRLFKTVRVNGEKNFLEKVNQVATALGFDPRYYVNLVDLSDKHRKNDESAPLVLLENGELVPITDVEPLVAEILKRPENRKSWLAVPEEVKNKLGRKR